MRNQPNHHNGTETKGVYFVFELYKIADDNHDYITTYISGMIGMKNHGADAIEIATTDSDIPIPFLHDDKNILVMTTTGDPMEFKRIEEQ